MRPALRQRLREAVPTAILAVTIYVPLLLTKPGRVGADTKSYLYLDPGRMLGRAATMWDPNIGMGTVTHQNIGYLWPIGPWYWLADTIGMADWVAQRLWLGTILFAAGVGVRFMLKALGQEGPHVTAATFVYALTPYVLSLAARLSVILLPYAGLPWMIGLAALALRRGGWRYPALFALVVATIGSVNATALVLAGIGPLLWIAYEVVITREARLGDAAKTVGRIGVMTIGCSLWWLAGLWAQGGYGIDILRFTETAETVATASLSLEVLRGLGYWFFYGEDRFGPWIAPSRSFTQRIDVVVLTYILPVLGLVGASVTRFRERTFFILLLAVGLFLAVGAHPWDNPSPAGSVVKAFLESEIGLSMRSLPRAAPLVVLSLSVFVGALVAAVTRNHQRWARPITAGVVILAVLSLPPLWRGQMVDVNLDRAEEIPAYWLEAAAALDARDDGTRVLEIPGQDFASYRWGTTVDPITPGLMDRPFVARELIPYGSAPSADVLNAVDRRLQEQVAEPDAIAPMARFMAVGDISVRSDLAYERYNTPRPRRLWRTLLAAEGLGEPIGFGGTERNAAPPSLPLIDEQELLTPPDAPDPPKVAIVPVEDPEKIVRTASQDQPIVMAGDGEGLVDLAAAGLVTGHELVFYAGTFADEPEALRAKLNDDAALVLTDTNRRAGRRWGTVRDTTGVTERPGQEPVSVDPKDQRLEIFPEATDDSFTVNDVQGGVWAEASAYGNAVSLTPEDDPNKAVDGDRSTSWRIGGFSSATGETLRLIYRDPVTTDHLTMLQVIDGAPNRFISQVEIRLDDGEPFRVDLDQSSRPADPKSPGQQVDFDRQSFSTIDITVTETDPGNLRRYDGISPVGFAEVGVVDESGDRPVADNVVRLPKDLLDEAGSASMANQLAIVLTRQRTASSVAVRSDPERTLIRTFSLPDPRSFQLVGQVRLAANASDAVIDAALGLPDATQGGVTATSGRRIPGGAENRAMSAIDGDPTTWYSPGFLGQQGEYLDYELPEPITFSRLDLAVLNDGRHSVPRTLRLEVDGELAQRITVPDIADQADPNAQRTLPIELDGPVTGSQIRITVDDGPDAVREVQTIDWFTDKPVTMPIGIVDLGIDGLEAPPMPERVDDQCRTDLMTVDGELVPVSIRATTADLLAGSPVDLVACDDDPLALPAGDTLVRTTDGRASGYDIDRLVLRSAPGGDASQSQGPLVDPATQTPRPDMEVSEQGRTTVDVSIPQADQDFWLILAQSYNEGWHATADGKDLGPPTLVNGYANGWKVPAGSDISVAVEWTPQRVVWSMIWASLAFVLLAVGLVLWPKRKGGTSAEIDDPADWAPLSQGASMPLAISWERARRYVGPAPSTMTWLGVTLAAAAVGFALTGPVGAVIIGASAAVTLRVARSRLILTLGAPLIVVATVGWMAARQHFDRLPPGFEWPTYFEGAQSPAWIAVLLLVLDAVVDRCWLRRWWATDQADT